MGFFRASSFSLVFSLSLVFVSSFLVPQEWSWEFSCLTKVSIIALRLQCEVYGFVVWQNKLLCHFEACNPKVTFLFFHKKSVKLVPLSSVVVKPSPCSCCRVRIVNPLEVLSSTQIEKVLSCFIRWGLHSLGYTNVSPFAVPAQMGIVIPPMTTVVPFGTLAISFSKLCRNSSIPPFPFDHNGWNAAASSNSRTRTIVVLSSKFFVWPSSIHALGADPRRIFPLLWEWTNTFSLSKPNYSSLSSDFWNKDNLLISLLHVFHHTSQDGPVSFSSGDPLEVQGGELDCVLGYPSVLSGALFQSSFLLCSVFPSFSS